MIILRKDVEIQKVKKRRENQRSVAEDKTRTMSRV